MLTGIVASSIIQTTASFLPRILSIPFCPTPISAHLQENRLIPLDDRLYFRPLPHPVPFACFKSVVICQSNYNDAERENLKRVTMCLGGKVRERLNSSVTHLVAKFAVGEKYQAMLKMGKPVVTGEWLYACAQQVSNKRVKEVVSWEFKRGRKNWGEVPSDANAGW
jgi:hypothetical protein